MLQKKNHQAPVLSHMQFPESQPGLLPTTKGLRDDAVPVPFSL